MSDYSNGNPLRNLPGIDRLLKSADAADLIRNYGRQASRDALRVALDAARQWIRQGGGAPATKELLSAAASWLRARHTPSLRPVINATGVILHTNLGRAPLSDSAQQAMIAVAAGYSTLEYDLDEGQRSKRERHLEALLTSLTSAEAALVVNNNAAALILILNALAQNREVLISRGQLIEIGGGFRLPDIMTQSGARLVEVGATNRTYIDDFSQAITPQTALIMRAHASNFKQLGFVEQPDLNELTRLAHANNLIALDDLGSGAMIDTTPYGLAHEPTVQESVQSGFDLVAFSGDKLLGGPQAGIIVGRKQLIETLKRHPLARALRIDKLSLAALFATVDHYRRGDAAEHLPIWQMISLPISVIRSRVEDWAQHTGGDIISGESTIGGGSLPGDTLATYLLALAVPQPDEFAAKLRRANPPIVARIERDRVLLDPRTVLPSQDSEVVRILQSVLAEINFAPRS